MFLHSLHQEVIVLPRTALPRRPLSKDEVRYVQEMACRIAAILLLEPALDANYQAIKANTYPWPPKS